MPAPDFSQLQLLILDVDGVLTDGRIGFTAQGDEIKHFSIRDGLAIRLAQRSGFQVAFLSGRSSPAVQRRAAELEVEIVIEGSRDKVLHLEEILNRLNLPASQAAAMGDDLLDIPLLERVHFSAAPSDAAPEVRRVVDYVSQCPGGRGAVREVIERILKARGQWQW